MKKFLLLCLCTLMVCGLGCDRRQSIETAGGTTNPNNIPQIKVFFSPKGGCADEATQIISGAKQSVLIQAYSFTHPKIADATAKAFEAGKNVKVILDKSNVKETYSAATFLANHKVPLWIDSKHAIAHNKIIIVDFGTPNEVLITGSFNFTQQAENSNAENMLVIRNDHDLINQYHDNFIHHLGHSDPYKGS